MCHRWWGRALVSELAVQADWAARDPDVRRCTWWPQKQSETTQWSLDFVCVTSVPSKRQFINFSNPSSGLLTYILSETTSSHQFSCIFSKLSNGILSKEKKGKIIGAVALCGTWLAGQEVVPAGEGRQPRHASQPCGVPALPAPASPANSPCD